MPLFSLRSLRARRWCGVVFIVLFTYFSVCAVLHYSVPNLIFYPPLRDVGLPSGHEFKIPVAPQAWINAVYLKAPHARSTILYSHGNAVDIRQLYPLLRVFQQHGYAVLAYDYEGYGGSSGKPSVAHTYRDVLAAYRYLRNHYHIPAADIMDYGHSLGTGLAVYLAVHRPVGSVVLQSPFLSIYRVVTHYPIFAFDVYPNLARIKDIHRPILIIHGVKDNVIPFWHGYQLYQQANEPKVFLKLPIGGHQVNAPWVYAPDLFWRDLAKISGMPV